jgi:hypothetical protein
MDLAQIGIILRLSMPVAGNAEEVPDYHTRSKTSLLTIHPCSPISTQNSYTYVYYNQGTHLTQLHILSMEKPTC